MNKLVSSFLDYQTGILGHSDNTAGGYAFDLGALCDTVAASRGLEPDALTASDFAAVTLEQLYTYMGAARDGGQLSAATRCRRASAAKSFYKYLLRRGLIDRDPAADLETPKKQKTLPRYLTGEECARLLDGCGQNKTGIRDRAILTLFLSCGLRVSELCALDLSDLGPDFVRVLGKGDKERIVYFSPACRAALDAYIQIRDPSPVPVGAATCRPSSVSPAAGPLFLSNYRERIAPRTVQAMLDRRLTAAGLDPSLYSPHKLRHTAATLMLKNGVDTRVLQEVLGHASLNTTQIYTHVESDALRAAAQAVTF